MKAIKAGVPNRAQRLEMRSQIFKLRQEEATLLRIAGLPVSAKAKSTKVNPMETSKAAQAIRKANIQLKLKTSKETSQQVDEREKEQFKPESESDEETENNAPEEPVIKASPPPVKEPELAKEEVIMENEKIPPVAASPEIAEDENMEQTVEAPQEEGEQEMVEEVLAKDEKKELPVSKEYEYEKLAMDENYATWLPPQNQSGDGTTSLNDKYGY
ncbi:hypothetical protein Ciccas_010569 [Cichlidogyrus casuarinus]|uniref:Uncharacterized protein n=1 Tax=Cichlidogyrus casuarinus TaxID=1844966 RepID=A0ABD2PUX3_9PLAT